MEYDNKKCCISIIIPVYNAEKYLKKCLNSIINQTLREIEVIIVNDGSTDNSEKIAELYSKQDERIKIYNQSNSGPLCARVKGIKASRGEYFTFCDADDYYPSSRSLEIMYSSITEDSCDMLQFSHYTKYNFYSKIETLSNKTFSREQFFADEYPKLLCSFWDESSLHVSVWDKLYSRKLITDSLDELINEKVFMGDDLIINLFLNENVCTAKYIDKALYCHKSSSGLTNHWKEKDMYDLNTIKKYQMRFIEHSDRKDKDILYKNFYSEIAAWIYSHIQQGLSQNRLSEIEMKNYIKDVLSLPSFIKAHDYYMSSQENWLAVNLIRNANPEEYIICTKNKKEKRFLNTLKQVVRKFI